MRDGYTYRAPKKIVRAAAAGARSFPVVHDDLDLDVAQAHVDAAVEALCVDAPAFARALKSVAKLTPGMGRDERVDLTRAAVMSFLGVKRSR